MAPDQLSGLVERQDVDALLALMHEIPVVPGDGVLIPGGTPHAIGEGILLVEAQEPTDQSILLERVGTTASDDEIFLGLDRELALSSVGTAATGDVQALLAHAVPDGGGAVSVLADAADPFFRMHLLSGGAGVEAGFAVVVVRSGSGSLVEQDGTAHALTAGQVWVVPAATGAWQVDGTVTVLACRAGTTWPPGVD